MGLLFAFLCLTPSLYTQCDQGMLMEESSGEAEKREELLKMYASLKEALKIIGDINVSTVAQNAPPPVDNSWIADTPKSSSAYQSNGIYLYVTYISFFRKGWHILSLIE